MAIVAIENYARLQLTFQVGTDEDGNPITKSRTYSNVKASATSAGLYAVSQSLAGLTSYPLAQVERLGSVEIVDQP